MDVEQKLKLQKLAGILVFLGLGSIVLSLFDYNFVLLAWMEFFGTTIAWGIRITLVVIGAILYFKYDVDDSELNFDEDDEI